MKTNKINFEELLLDTPHHQTRVCETVIVKIDGQPELVNIIYRDEFIKTFHELETLMRSDDGKWWILYEEHAPETCAYYEVFWAIPTSEVDFRRDPEGGWILVGRVTLDEDEEVGGLAPDEEDDLVSDAYTDALNNYTVFMHNLGKYILYNPKADAVVFKFYKSIQEWTDASTPDVCSDNKVCFMEWIEHHWGAYMVSILNNEFKYMNLTQLVLDSWLE